LTDSEALRSRSDSDNILKFCTGDTWATFAPRPHLILLIAILATLDDRGGRHCAHPINLNYVITPPCERHYSSRRVIMAELKRDEDLGSTRLSTAALAHADEPVEQKLVENREDGRDMNASVDRHVNATSQPAETDAQEALFSQDESKQLYAKWDAIQVGFVDEPRQAVERADSLVAGAMKRLAEVFAEERARLEGQWDRGDNVSTEELRLALRRYRAFFGRLLSV
jgi:hypothetical protein